MAFFSLYFFRFVRLTDVTGQDARVCGVSRGEAQAAYFKRGGSLVLHISNF